MAQSFVTQDGIRLVNPGTYVSTKVQPGVGAIASAGVVTIVGEANEGPGWQDEVSLENVAYDPSQFQEALLKYGSGNIVEALAKLISAANDPNIVGSVSLVRIVKTNRSTAAAAVIARTGFGSYANLSALRRGQPGNLIKWRSEVAKAEIAPDSGDIAYTPISGSDVFSVRVNGGTQKNIPVTARLAPMDLCSAIEDIDKGILASGGAEKDSLTGLANGSRVITASVPAAGQLAISIPAGAQWNPAPLLGDVLVIPATGEYAATADSVLAGAGNANVGSYIVTSVSNTPTSARIVCQRVDGGSTVAASGIISADENDIICFAPIRLRNVTGMDRGSNIGISGQYSILSNDGTNVVVQLPTSQAWAAQPKVGDYLKLASAFGGLQPGFYQVAASNSTSVSFFRLSNGSAGNSAPPANIVSPIVAGSEPFSVLKPVIDGLGKTLEVAGNTSAYFRNKLTLAPAALSDAQLASAQEYQNVTTFTRQQQADAFTVGGDVVISFGSEEVDAQVVIGANGIDFQVASVSQFTASFSQFVTLQDLADYVNSQTGWRAAVTTARFALAKPSDLDQGSFGASAIGSFRPARIKRDATQWEAATAASSLVSAELVSQSGLPEQSTPDRFLSGGSKGGTTSAGVTAAIDAIEQLDTNFIVPLFSRDASEDINDGQTESSSTYTIDAINAYTKSHVIKMSAVEMRKNRSAVCSKRAPFEVVKDAAGDLANFRCGLAFQDVVASSAGGVITQFQPWYAACVAVGMQSAAGYRGIVKKFANVNGIVSPFGDFNARNPGDTKEALEAGLLCMEPVSTGGVRWISDQTTYSADNNFVYNSLQAVYVSDLITLTLIDRFDRAVVGQSVADITAAAALGVLAGEMFNFKRLKFIAASDDAPEGYRNAKAKLRGGVLEIFCECKLAGLIYFVPIYLTLSQVQQDASQ